MLLLKTVRWTVLDIKKVIDQKNFKQLNTKSAGFLIFLGSNLLIRNTSQYLYAISYSTHRPLLLQILIHLPQNVMFAFYIYGFLIPNQFHFIVLF